MSEPNHLGVPLKEFIEQRIDALEQAVVLAARQMESRLESMNEFRQSLRDQSALSVTRTEYSAMASRLSDDIANLKDATAQEIKNLREQTRDYITRTDYVKIAEDIKMLRESKALLEGKASQQSVNIALILAVIGIIIALGGMVSKFVK
jgi:hypothetical protein